MSKAAAAAITGIKPEDVTVLRDFSKGLLVTLNGLNLEGLSEPYKKALENLQATYNGVLSQLPPLEQVPAALEANSYLRHLLSLMMDSQVMFNCLSTRVQELTTRNSGADQTAIETAVEAAIAKKIKDGELVAKELVTSLCSNAKIEGLAEGEKKVRDEQAAAEAKAKTIADRKTLLTTNSLPFPKANLIEAVLGVSDEEFNKAKDVAAQRTEKLKGKKIALNSPLMHEVWSTDDQFSIVENVLASVTPGSSKTPAEPLATGAPGTAKTVNIIL